jgi:hypothetical protein
MLIVASFFILCGLQNCLRPTFSIKEHLGAPMGKKHTMRNILFKISWSLFIYIYKKLGSSKSPILILVKFENLLEFKALLYTRNCNMDIRYCGTRWKCEKSEVLSCKTIPLAKEKHLRVRHLSRWFNRTSSHGDGPSVFRSILNVHCDILSLSHSDVYMERRGDFTPILIGGGGGGYCWQKGPIVLKKC